MIATVVCRGYGSFGGGVKELPTFGYTSGTPAVFCAGMYRPGSVDRGSSYYASQDQSSTRFASEESASSYENRACDQQL